MLVRLATVVGLSLALAPGGTRAATSPPWQLRYVDLRIAVDPGAKRVDGVARLTLTPAAGASDLVLDLSDSLTVDSARVVAPRDNAALGVREPGTLRFHVTPRGGERLQVAVWYHGQPARRAVGFAGPAPAFRVASFGLPRSAREWWPVIDDPAQKADSADVWITAPSPLTAVSVGRLVSRTATTDGNAGTTSHWSTRHPVYPDAISFALGDYVVTRQTAALSGGKTTPVELYLFPEDSAKGAADFAPVPAILAFYTSRLGPYPFANEKYALVEFARPSFREAQTLSHIGAGLITGKHDNEQVFAHEIAHQWFGNGLTVRTWEDIWLNESLSEYMAWQWVKRTRGDTAYKALVDGGMAAAVAAPIVPANPADFSTLFGAATFQRGPAVLDALEHEMGEKAFGAALKAYVSRHMYGVVETADFQRACETAYGKPLDGFFARWVRGRGH